MARTRIKDPAPTLESWDAVNEALAEIGRHQRYVEGIEAAMQESIELTKRNASEMAAPHQKTILLLEGQIKRYADLHRAEMGTRKTMDLNYGKTGFRQSTRVVLPNGKAAIAEVVRKLKEHGLIGCIVTPPERVNKDAMRQYTATQLEAVGATLACDDVFWYEVDREKLKEAQAQAE